MQYYHPYVQMRKLGQREVKSLAQVCTANKWQTQDFSHGVWLHSQHS